MRHLILLNVRQNKDKMIVLLFTAVTDNGIYH